MSGVATAIVGGAIIGGVASNLAAGEQASAAESAANTQAAANTRAAELQLQAQRESNALQKEMYYKNIELQEPWRAAGQNALGKLTAGINAGQFGTVTPYAQATPFSFTAAEFAKQQDPGYAFRLAEGNRALNQAAAARGGLISGNALKAAQRYGQEMGSQEFQNAYNRALTGYNVNEANRLTAYNANQQAKSNAYNQLAGVSGTGQTTAQQIASLGSQYASNVGNAATNAANAIGGLYSNTGASTANSLLAQGAARSSAYQGYGSAAGQALSGLSNWYSNLNRSNTGGGYTNQVYDANGIPLTSTGKYGFGD